MSLAGNKAPGRWSRATVDVYLATRQVALQHADGALWTRSATDINQALSAVTAEIGRLTDGGVPQPRQIRVWLGASLCRPVRLAAVKAALSSRELVRVNEASAIALAALPTPGRVWLDAPDATGGRLAVVVEQRALDSLEAMASGLRARLASVRPFWAEVLKMALLDLPGMEAMAVWEGEALTLLVGTGETISVARTTVPVNDAASASAALRRTGIAEGIDLGQSLAIGLNLRANGATSAADPAFPSLQGLPFGACIEPLEAPR